MGLSVHDPSIDPLGNPLGLERSSVSGGAKVKSRQNLVLNTYSVATVSPMTASASLLTPVDLNKSILAVRGRGPTAPEQYQEYWSGIVSFDGSQITAGAQTSGAWSGSPIYCTVTEYENVKQKIVQVATISAANDSVSVGIVSASPIKIENCIVEVYLNSTNLVGVPAFGRGMLSAYLTSQGQVNVFCGGPKTGSGTTALSITVQIIEFK